MPEKVIIPEHTERLDSAQEWAIAPRSGKQNVRAKRRIDLQLLCNQQYTRYVAANLSGAKQWHAACFMGIAQFEERVNRFRKSKNRNNSIHGWFASVQVL